MRKFILLLAAVVVLLTGCAASQAVIENANNTTATVTPTPEPSDTPTPTPTEAPQEEDTIKDPMEAFTEKVTGVWGNDGGVFEQFEGTTIKRGWFGSDILPDATIADVNELSENKYEVYVEDRGVVDDPYVGFEYQGEDYTAIFDGSIDGFKTLFVLSYGDTDTLFVRMGDTFEEADEYYWAGFRDDYRKLNTELMGVPDLGTLAAGVWYTDGYDELNDWAGSYKLDLGRDGSATCFGWRNNDSGSYEIIGDNTVLITFDHCEIDSPGEGWVPVEGFVYTIEMTINGDDAQIKIDAPDVISNLMDGQIHRKGTYL